MTYPTKNRKPINRRELCRVLQFHAGSTTPFCTINVLAVRDALCLIAEQIDAREHDLPLYFGSARRHFEAERGDD